MSEIGLLGFGEQVLVEEVGNQYRVGEAILLDQQIHHFLVLSQNEQLTRQTVDIVLEAQIDGRHGASYITKRVLVVVGLAHGLEAWLRAAVCADVVMIIRAAVMLIEHQTASVETQSRVHVISQLALIQVAWMRTRDVLTATSLQHLLVEAQQCDEFLGFILIKRSLLKIKHKL